MEIAFNIGLNASFENMQVCKGIQLKAREVNSSKTYVKIVRLSTECLRALHWLHFKSILIYKMTKN